MLALAACVTPPPRVVSVPAPQPRKIFVYPTNGQTPEQTDRDRYECHLWAVQQTGVDPSRADASAYERVVVQPATPPGANTAAGAVIGSAADANAQTEARQTQQQINMSAADGRARADAYSRALGACLQGRGYTVS
jgi:hypothetical protein